MWDEELAAFYQSRICTWICALCPSPFVWLTCVIGLSALANTPPLFCPSHLLHPQDTLQSNAIFCSPFYLFCSQWQVLQPSTSRGQSPWSHWWTDGDRINKSPERRCGFRKDLVAKALLWTSLRSCCDSNCRSQCAAPSALTPVADIPQLSPSLDLTFSSGKKAHLHSNLAR